MLTLISLNRYVYLLLFSSSESTTAVTDEPKKDEATTDVPVLSNGELKGSAYWDDGRGVFVLLTVDNANVDIHVLLF